VTDPAQNSERAYLLFVWKASGYELRERKGEPPAVGDEVEDEDVRLRVLKVGASPLPGDSRPCAYANPLR
jgi:hypothetical protein